MNDIVIEALCKSYGDKKVLENFSAVIKRGETTCIMGQSGCGKTTLLNILMGLEKADSGRLSGLPENMSAVFQEDRLCEEFSALANIKLVTGKNIADTEITRQLELLGIAAKDINKPVGEYSGGMKRRVAIARALLYPSDIIFLDEPFKGLDAATKQLVINYLKSITKGKTLVIVTHDTEESKKLGGIIIEFKNVVLPD